MSQSAEAGSLGTPHGKEFYALMALLGLIGTCGFGYGTFAAPTVAQRLVEALIALVFLAGAIEAIDRLARPRAAHARSIHLSASRRRILRGTRTVLVRTAWVLFFAGILLHLSSSDTISGAGTDMQISAVILWFGAWCVADYCGDQLGAFSRRLA
jgi:hypothetical protein